MCVETERGGGGGGGVGGGGGGGGAELGRQKLESLTEGKALSCVVKLF